MLFYLGIDQQEINRVSYTPLFLKQSETGLPGRKGGLQLFPQNCAPGEEFSKVPGSPTFSHPEYLRNCLV